MGVLGEKFPLRQSEEAGIWDGRVWQKQNRLGVLRPSFSLTTKECVPKGSQPLAFGRLVKRSWTQRRYQEQWAANLWLMMTLSAALSPQGASGVNLSCGTWPTGPATNVQDMKQIPLAPERSSKAAASAGLQQNRMEKDMAEGQHSVWGRMERDRGDADV